jgi:phage shock protein C
VANRHVAGVCGGLAEYVGLDPVVVRVGFVLLLIITGTVPLAVIYFVLWILIPEREYY